MSKKVYVQKQSDKPLLPYCVKAGRFTVSVHTEEEAKRVQKFTEKLINVLSPVQAGGSHEQ